MIVVALMQASKVLALGRVLIANNWGSRISSSIVVRASEPQSEMSPALATIFNLHERYTDLFDDCEKFINLQFINLKNIYLIWFNLHERYTKIYTNIYIISWLSIFIGIYQEIALLNCFFFILIEYFFYGKQV